MTIPVLVQQIFEICIIPLLGLLTTYIISFVKAKNKEIQTNIDNELYIKYMNMLEKTIVKCVVATNQTYVDALKAQNGFGPEEQKQAFNMTYQAVLSILTNEAKTYLEVSVGDFQMFLMKQIEATVRENKLEIVEEKI